MLNFHKLTESIKNYRLLRKNIQAATKVSMPFMLLDIIWCRFRYKTNITDYKQQQFYLKSGLSRSQFLGWHDAPAIQKKYNNYDYADIFKNKKNFNETFSDFIGREWIYAPDHTDIEIMEFIKKWGAVFVKPVDQMKGINIFKQLACDINNPTEFCAKVRDEACLIEEVIVQHPVLARISPNSVNSIRINSIVDSAGNVQILNAVLRCSINESVIDNISAGGIATGVDVDTGILYSDSTTDDGVHFMRHPHTGVVLPGIEVPIWQEVIDLVKKAAKVVPQMRLVGWDVAITEKGPLLIEGNHQSGFATMQHSGKGVKKIVLG